MDYFSRSNVAYVAYPASAPRASGIRYLCYRDEPDSRKEKDRMKIFGLAFMVIGAMAMSIFITDVLWQQAIRNTALQEIEEYANERY